MGGDYQDWARRFAQDRFAHAADEHLMQRAMSMRSDDDQVYLQAGGFMEDGFRRGALYQ